MRTPAIPSIYLILLVILPSCRVGSSDIPPEDLPENYEIVGVSVWDRISSRSEPRRSSERVTLLSLGETFLYLDSSAVDSSYNNTRLLHVQLSDSSRVWVYDFASVLNAEPAVMLGEVPLYLRPDLLTITDQRLYGMEIVAVVEEWDDWIKIVNEKKENVGWIKKEFVTYEPVDLAFALLAKRNLEEEDPERRLEKLQDLLDKNPYPETGLVPELRQRLEEERENLRESEKERDRNDRDRRNRRDRD